MKRTNLIALIIVVIVVVGLILFYGYPKGISYSQGSRTPQPATQNQNNVYMMENSPTLGQYLADPKGMTLYTFKNDTPGVSNCTDSCLQNWPPYLESNTINNLPQDIGTIKRVDGTTQFTWKGLPLYYFSGDKNPGDTNGEEIVELWYVAK